MRMLLAVLMTLHGLAHLPGFLVSWQIGKLEGSTYKTTVLAGRLDLGEVGIRVVGVVWLVAAIAFLLSASAAFQSRSVWPQMAFAVAGASLLLSVLAWPGSRIGVPVNLAIGLLAAGQHFELI